MLPLSQQPFLQPHQRSARHVICQIIMPSPQQQAAFINRHMGSCQ
jgi:ribosomal protein L18